MLKEAGSKKQTSIVEAGLSTKNALPDAPKCHNSERV